MDKLNFVKDGAVNLPPGFRFQPTDEEIVFQYLARRVTSSPLPASVIPDIENIFNYDPWTLPGDVEEDKYFFSKREDKYRNGNRSNRASASGYWKATGLDKHITFPTRRNIKQPIMGMRKTLVFYRGKHPHSSRSNWIMHEYRLLQSLNNQNCMKQMGDWVLCHIFAKNDDAMAGSLCYGESSYCTSSSTSFCMGSSVMADQQGSSYESDHEETSTAYNM
ncbi:hypothetical protein ACET3Z_022689 [Daucus carota]